jgi:hypothetical protein
MKKTTLLGTLGGIFVRAPESEEAVVETAMNFHRPPLNGVAVRDCPTVRIDLEVFARLRMYVESASGEISLLGASEYRAARNEILVKQIYLPAQTCTACSTVIGEDALAETLLQAARDGFGLDVWIHSHAEMGTFFSQTDQHSIEQAFPQSPRVLSLVVNRAGDMLARLTLTDPLQIELDHLPIRIGVPFDIEAAIRAEVRQKVHGYDRWSSAGKPAGSEEKKPTEEKSNGQHCE